MRIHHYLLVASAVFVVNSEAARLARTAVVATKSFLSVNGAKSSGSTARFLRVHNIAGTTDTDETSDEEERMNLNLSPAAEQWLAGIAGKSNAELEKLAQAPKNVNLEETLAKMVSNVEAHFTELAEKGATPKTMYKDNKIRLKRKTMTNTELMRDADYQEYVRFKEFWDNAKRAFKAKKTTSGKS